MKRYLLPDNIDESAIETGLGSGHSLVFGPPSRLTVTYLDTFDWRLHKAGLALAEERGRRRSLVLQEPGCEPLVVAAASTPKVAADLPNGHIADTVTPLLDIRALVQVGQTRVERVVDRLAMFGELAGELDEGLHS